MLKYQTVYRTINKGADQTARNAQANLRSCCLLAVKFSRGVAHMVLHYLLLLIIKIIIENASEENT